MTSLVIPNNLKTVFLLTFHVVDQNYQNILQILNNGFDFTLQEEKNDIVFYFTTIVLSSHILHDYILRHLVED